MSQWDKNSWEELPDKRRKLEVWECIMGLFDYLSAAHSHMSLTVANMSSLAKISDEETFNTVLKASIHPMLQLNVPKKYLKPTKHPKLETTVATRLEKLWKVLLPNLDCACIA